MNIELLAPAGSYESMVAAYNAGADAVYIGGMKFGARAFADNLDEERMKQAIDYAHLHDKKLFLTVNTLLKDSELECLYDYLYPYYREGLDAVIVQDLGVFDYIRSQFPHMDIHASTQMTVTGVESARYLKSLGASRVVTAREMNLDEIKLIHDNVDVEIETFVHGALCFCYSGQCLLSSIIGGRSGNRGRCAQPCRLPYELYEGEKKISDQQSRYLMSPKDMCSVNLIPDLIEAGIYSFKMEGRMKKPEYTAGITSIYRKYIDLYAEKGKKGFSVSQEDYQILMDLYNRGGFSEGYFHKHNGKDMMSMQRPNHQGTKAVKVLMTTGSSMKCKAVEDLHKKDVLELPGKKDLTDVTLDMDVKAGAAFQVKLPREANVKKDMVLYRTRNQYLIDSLTEQYIKRNSKLKIKGNLILSLYESAMMTLTCGNYIVTVTGDLVQEASKRPVTKEEVEKQIRKTGQTNMEFESVDIQMDSNIFIPMQALNELRRNGIQKLEEAILSSTERKIIPRREPVHYTPESGNQMLTVSVETKEQFELALKYPEVQRIYVSYLVFADAQVTDAFDYITKGHNAGKEVYYITSWIHRQEKKHPVLPEIEVLEQFDGILCKSLETYAMIKEKKYPKPVVADYNLYSFNQQGRAFLKEQGFVNDTVPVELKFSEISRRGCMDSEMIIYGYLPLMISAQCFRRNTRGCDKKPSLSYLKDRKGMRFPVKNLCGYCCNIIYNSAPLELADQITEIQKLNPGSIRISLTIEEHKEAKMVLDCYTKAYAENVNLSPVHENFTRGHYKRGVE